MALHLTNTLSGKKELFKPLGDTVKIYICGMTVQGPPHFGHMRAYITADILLRYLEFSGYKTKVIQNFTDIDDKIIEKSLEEKTDYWFIAERNIQEYHYVAEKMNIRPADIYPKPTQHITRIIELIEKLITKGFGYVANGDVYFAIEKFPEYGKLSKKKLDDLIAGSRVEVREHKKNPADFALWKAAKPGEPSWYSPWSKGRPGWSIECSAMSMHYLGETLDLHLGGEDLIFPHHENEIAQSEAATGKPFVKYWIHNAMLNLTGEKMSKSTKHFITAKELLEKYEYKPNVLRLYFLKSHYRSPQEFDYKILDSNKESWARIEEFLYSAEEAGAQDNSKFRIQNSKFSEAMDDDLNTPKIMALLFDAVKEGFSLIQNKSTAELNKKYLEVLFYLKTLGFKTDILSRTEKRISQGTQVSSRLEIRDLTILEKAEELAVKRRHFDIAYLILKYRNDYNKLLETRELSRKRKEYEIADLIRDGMLQEGVVIEDTESGPKIKIKNKE